MNWKFLKPCLPLILATLAVFGVGCIWLEPSVLSAFYGEEVIDREQAKNELRSAVRLNLAGCPENNGPGLFAIEFLIPNEISQRRYYRESIENCATVILLVPCDPTINIESEDQDQVEAQLFLPALRVCNPRPVAGSPFGE